MEEKIYFYFTQIQDLIRKRFNKNEYSEDNLWKWVIHNNIITTNSPPAIFDWRRYLTDHPDLTNANIRNGMDACRHYLHHGIFEARKCYKLNSNDEYRLDLDIHKFKNHPEIMTRVKGILADYAALFYYIENHDNIQMNYEEKNMINPFFYITNNKNINKLWTDSLNKIINSRSNSIYNLVNRNNIKNIDQNNTKNLNRHHVEEISTFDMYNKKSFSEIELELIFDNINEFTSNIIENYKNILFICGDYPGYGGAAFSCYEPCPTTKDGWDTGFTPRDLASLIVVREERRI